MTMSGTANLNVQNGSITVDSVGPKVFNDSSSVKSQAPSFSFSSDSTLANLGISPASNYFSSPTGGTPSISYSQTATADPLSYLPAPTTSGLTTQSGSLLSISSGFGTLSPGLYTGGISVSGSATVTLNAGEYYLNGPLTWNSSGTLDGSRGVFIYVAPGASTNGISITSGTMNLAPMSTGTYQGIAFYQDRTSTASVELSGGSGWNLKGTVYAAKAPVTLSGPSSSTDTRGSQFIVNTLTLTGSSTIAINAANAKAPTTRLFQLVE
jgi:hypothetical protein